jgi:hypothetical protein
LPRTRLRVDLRFVRFRLQAFSCWLAVYAQFVVDASGALEAPYGVFRLVVVRACGGACVEEELA